MTTAEEMERLRYLELKRKRASAQLALEAAPMLDAEKDAAVAKAAKSGDWNALRGVMRSQAEPQREGGDPGLATSMGHKFLSGFTKRFSDEIIGKGTQATVDADPSGSTQWRDHSAKSGTRALKTGQDVYHAGRNGERDVLKRAGEHHPVPSFVAEVGGDIASDAVLGAFGAPVGSPAYQAIAGAASGVGGSDSDSVGGMLWDGAKGGLAGYLLPKVGGAIAKKVAPAGIGAKFRDALGGRIKAAETEIAERAGKKLAEARSKAWGPYGQKVAELNRKLEIIDRRFPGATDEQIAAALTKEGHPAQAAAITAMREQLFKANAEGFSEVGNALATQKEGWDAFKRGAGDLGEQMLKSEANPLNQVIPWAKRYAAPIIGSVAGGPAGMLAGLAAGGGGREALEQAAGGLAGAGMRPAAQATVRRLLHPSIRKLGLRGVENGMNVLGALGEVAPFLGRPLMSEAQALAEALRDEEPQP
jgi:hypothetical protein